MHTTQQQNETWQDNVIESIVDFAKADDGDFKYIYKLSKAVDEPYGVEKMVKFLSQTPQAKKAFQERKILGNIDLHKLYSLPSNTLGYAFAKHMLDRGLEPLKSDALTADDEVQFLGIHIKETHDIWHVVIGADTDILGELQLEAFCVSQLYATRFWLALIVKNLLKSTIDDIEASTKYMDAITRGWLIAKQAKPLFGIKWDELWEHPLEEVRADLNIIFPDT
ncbi:MAG: Coq4 family protein [Cyanobacteria bacterium J06636_27]